MASMSVSGVVSGMDWDSMIDSIIESAAKPAQPKVSKKTNLTNKKSLFEEMKVTMNSLQSSLSPLKLPSTYKAKDIEIERLDNAGYSYKGVLTATVNADADVNVWEVEVKQLATAQTNRSKQISASTLASTLSGVSGSTFYINAGGQKIGIEVKSDDTLQSLKSRINTTLKTLDNPIHVTASVVDNRLILKSDYTGLGTFTAEETVNYNSTGINRLSNFSVNDSDRENVTITNGSTKYTYGTDFEIANGNEIRWKQYDRSAEVALNDTVNVKYTMAAGDRYKNRGTYGTGEAEIENFNVKDFGTLSSRLTILGDDNVTYKYGQDFTIKDGKVVWLEEESEKTNEPSSYTVSYTNTAQKAYSASGSKTSPTSDITDITMSKFAELQTKYAEAESSELPTVTLLDGNNVLRTYVDPEDPSLFTMSAGGKDYVYGRDYVLRVNDAGTGYRFDWLVENSDTIADANTTVTTYAAYKNISTSSWQAAPVENTEYKFGFSYSYASTKSGTVNSSQTDKTLAHVLPDTTVSSSDYSSALTITSGSKTYTYGKDYVVDKTRTITWLNQNSTTPAAYTANYTFSTTAASTTKSLNSATSTYVNVSGVPSLDSMGVSTFSSGSDPHSYVYINADEGKAAFTMTDSDGNTYEYGKDYAIRTATGSTGSGGFVVVWPTNPYWPTSELGTQTTSMPKSGLTLTYNNSVSRTVISSETVKDALGFLPSDDSKLSITDNDGNAYVKDTDYTLDPSTGAVTWLNATSTAPKHPSSGVGYTLVYDAFTAIDYNGTYSGTATQEAEIVVDSGYGNYDGNKRSYEQILSDTGLTSSSESSDWAKYFTLTDGTTTYTYGTDYTIIQGSDTDSDTGEHNVLINWLSGGAKPSSTFALSYGGNGGESLTTKGVTRSAVDTISGSPLAADFDDGTTTITYGGKTFYNGIDFNIGKDDDGNATVEWVTDGDGGYEWYYPTSNSRYTINHTDDNGSTTSYSATRTGSSVLSMSDYGMTSANGSLVVHYGDEDGLSYNLDAATDSSTGFNGHDVIKGTYGIDITPTTGSSFTFNWAAPTLTSRTNLPSYGTELKVQYEYDANTFDLADDCDGELLYALGYTKSDGSYDDYTAAQDAEIYVDGNLSYRASNDIGADYDNELIKGVTMHLKGTGTVSLDISHDAQKAVEAIQSFVDNYNDLMTWMNTRMTEKEVDKDTKSTIDSDDFRMRWGLLHGNSLLRQTKTQMRSLTSQNFTFSFTQRKSSEEVYGTMAFNGLRTTSTLRLRIGTKYVDVTIDPADTLETIVAKINDDTKGGPMNDIYYDSDGNKLASPLLKASVENDKLVINSTSSDEITMSGSAAMNVLKMNYTYKGLYQIGIESTSDDYGKSGELVFDANEFMEALEDNPDEVQSLMLKFVDQFSTWTRSMLNSSSSGETSGTLTREIENIQSQIDDINEYLEKYQERLDRMEESLRTRYANTETSLSKLNQQAASIASILNQLNGAANNNNSNS